MSFIEQFPYLSEKQRNLHFARWRKRFVEEEYPKILNELGLSGYEKNKQILSPFRNEKHPSFVVNFAVDDPAHHFLFYDFATQQKGAGTLAFRMIQQGVDLSQTDDYLMQIALQRDYETYLNSQSRPYIELVKRYQDRIEYVIQCLIDWKIIPYAPAFHPVMVQKFDCEQMRLKLIRLLAERFSDEQNPELSENNRHHLARMATEFQELLFDVLEGLKGQVWLVYDKKGEKVVNLWQSQRVFPFHRFDEAILPVKPYINGSQSLFLTDNVNTAREIAKTMSVMLLENQVALSSQVVSLWQAPKLLRNVLYTACFYAQRIFVDDQIAHHFFGILLNQLHVGQQAYLFNVERGKPYLFYDSRVDVKQLISQMADDEKQMQQFAKQWKASDSEFERKRLGMWNVRPENADLYRHKLFDLICGWGNSHVNFPVYLEMQWFSPQQVRIPEAKPVLGYLPPVMTHVTEYCNRIKLNKWLAEHLDPVGEFAQKRNLTKETIKTFGVGLATSEVFFKGLEALQFHPVYFQDKQLHKRIFDGLIAFPIRDEWGNVIAFGGRYLDENVRPKYINSATYEIYNELTQKSTLLFDKKACWYGLYEAQQAIFETGQVIVVEGYMDVLKLHQIGIRNVVATMGTAVSEEKFKKLFQIANQVILLLDGDIAGLLGTRNACQLAVKWEKSEQVYAILLPKEQDPDSYIESGKDIQALLKSGYTAEDTINLIDQLERFYWDKRQWLSNQMVEKRKRNVFYYL